MMKARLGTIVRSVVAVVILLAAVTAGNDARGQAQSVAEQVVFS